MNHPNRSRRWQMTPGELSAAINEVSNGNQSEFSRIIGVDGSTVRRWLSGDMKVYRPVQLLIRVLVRIPEEQRDELLAAVGSSFNKNPAY